MREDKLGDLSMELSVDILQLTKELRAKRENDRPEAILSSKINIAQMQDLLSLQSPENRGRKICL